jgi:hypothetical protein
MHEFIADQIVAHFLGWGSHILLWGKEHENQAKILVPLSTL